MKLSKGEREGTNDSGVHPEPQETCEMSRERRPWAWSILALVLPNAREEMTRLGAQSSTSGGQEPEPRSQGFLNDMKTQWEGTVWRRERRTPSLGIARVFSDSAIQILM